MQQVIRWVSVAALALVSIISTSSNPAATATTMTDPQTAVDQQFAAIPPIPTRNPTAEATAQWLDAVTEIMNRVALGGLGQLPVTARAAVDTVANVIVHNDNLMKQHPNVLRKVFELTPAVWTSGYWYVPLSTWQSVFDAIWTKSVAVAKLVRDSTDTSIKSSEPFDAAVNAAALIVRFTKDNYFVNGEPDTFDAASDSGLPSAREYLAHLPSVVAALASAPSPQTRVELSEHDFRVFMNNSLPSKRDGMDTSVAFPTYVDTARYKKSDAAALRAFIAAISPTPAQPL